MIAAVTVVIVSLSRYGVERRLLAIAHRGGAGLAPENTMAAFERSYALGLRYLETDVRVTSDGVCLAFHDARLDRVTDARGFVRRRTWRELRGLLVNGSEPVARLDDVLTAFPDARFVVDVKDEAAIAPLAAMLRATGAVDRVCVAGAWDGWLARLRTELGPALSCALGWRALAAWLMCSRLGAPLPTRLARDDFVHVPLRCGKLPVFIDRLVEGAHDLGLRLIVWTVDDPASMRRLITAGVDGIITDRPDVLREVMIATDRWIPAVYAEREPRYRSIGRPTITALSKGQVRHGSDRTGSGVFDDLRVEPGSRVSPVGDLGESRLRHRLHRPHDHRDVDA